MMNHNAPEGVPLVLTLCLEQDSILVSSAVLGALGFPRQIQMMINDEQKKLLLQSCSVEDREAVVVSKPEDGQFEMSGHSLIKRIRKLTGWADMMPRVLQGDYISQYHAIVFDLTKSRIARLAEPNSTHM